MSVARLSRAHACNGTVRWLPKARGKVELRLSVIAVCPEAVVQQVDKRVFASR